MTPHNLMQLVSLTRAQLMKEEQRAQPGLAAIRNLRAQRAAVDALDRTSRPSADAHPIRATGADVLWQGWLDRQRRELNMQLARQLAEQDHIMRDLKKAQGRHDALTSVLEEATLEAKRHLARTRDQDLLEMGLRSRRQNRLTHSAGPSS